MLQLVLTVIIFMIIVIPIGNYLYHIASGQRTFADPVFDRVDGGIYKVCGIHPDKGMNWKQYALALLLTNAVMVFVGYLVLRIQILPALQPQRHRRDGGDPVLQHHHQLHDQHQLTALLR